MKRIAVFGGSFDPVHLGHINISLAILSHFHFDTFNFVPCKIPVIKGPTHVDSQHRIAMLQLALNPYPNFNLDLREIKRPTPSYMVDTLRSYRQEFPTESITLTLGYDSFASLRLWKEWETLLKLANILVANRPFEDQNGLDDIMNDLLKSHQCLSTTEFLDHPFGRIFLFDAGNYAISSSQIRALLKEGKSVDDYLPAAVSAYIQSSGLYA